MDSSTLPLQFQPAAAFQLEDSPLFLLGQYLQFQDFQKRPLPCADIHFHQYSYPCEVHRLRKDSVPLSK